jgi:hypothetical protein
MKKEKKLNASVAKASFVEFLESMQVGDVVRLTQSRLAEIVGSFEVCEALRGNFFGKNLSWVGVRRLGWGEDDAETLRLASLVDLWLETRHDIVAP